MADLTTIQIGKETREELKQFGVKDETYDEILQKMMEMARKQLFFERQKNILKNEEFVPLGKV
jgi:uroporphyrinogen-III synthase